MESPIFLADFVAYQKTWNQNPEVGPGTQDPMVGP